MRSVWIPAGIACVGLAAAFCGRERLAIAWTEAPEQVNAQDDSAAQWKPQRIESHSLPNAYRLHEKVISGGGPDGENAFEELRELGVKTIISVDGAKPEAELAKKYGLRYVHLPHSYNGIPVNRARELAKAVRDLPGQIYIHCHHGKHRSPAAAAVACVECGFLTPAEGLAVLKAAGTSQDYRGLYQVVEQGGRIDDALLDALRVEFTEVVAVPPLAESMVAIEHTHDHLKTIDQAGWKVPPDHPDLDPPHEALLLREHFTELLRTDEVQSHSERFREILKASETAAEELEAALKEWSGDTEKVPDAITGAFSRITMDCKACHKEFRDTPLSEKGRK